MDGLGLQLVAVDRVLLFSLYELRVGAPVVHLLRVLTRTMLQFAVDLQSKRTILSPVGGVGVRDGPTGYQSVPDYNSWI